MQSEPDEQSSQPDSRDGDPRDAVGDGAAVPPEPGAMRPEQEPHAAEPQDLASEGPSPAGDVPDPARQTPSAGVPPPAMPPPPRMPSMPPGNTAAWRPAPPLPPGAVVEGVPPRAGEALTPDAPSADVPPPAPTLGPREVPAGQTEPLGPGDGGIPAAATLAEGDWLASICPYLASEDGTYRSAEADEGHRCTAQDPPATLPLAFQERFCLTDRHTRCEMYKFAREATPDVTEVPVAMGTQPLRAARPAGTGAGGVDRKLVAAAAGLGGVVVLVVILVLVLGSCWSPPAGTNGGATPDPGASVAAAATAAATDVPTPRPAEATEGPDRSPDPSEAATGPDVVIRYQVQEGEALLAIAEEFGITRRRLQRMNEALEEIPPAELPGMEILVPVPASMTVEELEALPGYLGMADGA